MDYSTVDPASITVDANNNIVVPQPVSLDALNGQLNDLQNALSNATKDLQETQNRVTSIQNKITALQNVIATATSQGALPVATFEANQSAKIAPTPMTL